MNDKVQYPIFELVGPSCKSEGCQGVLVQYLTRKESYYECSVCGTQFSPTKGQIILDFLSSEEGKEKLAMVCHDIIRSGKG